MNKDLRIKELLKGALDLHMHCDPSFMERTVDIWDAAIECSSAGMRGIGVKDHNVNLGVGAYIVNKHMPRSEGSDFQVFGSICLNNDVGFNPRAVDSALRLGTKIVYLPTTASLSHIKQLEQSNTKGAHFIPAKYTPKRQEPLVVINEDGSLKSEIKEIMRIIKENDGMLATGHISYDECLAVVRYAKEIGLKRVSLTHLPQFTTFDFDKLSEIVNTIGIVEANLSIMLPVTPEFVRMDAKQFADHIRFFGVEHCSLASDAGSIVMPRPVKCLSAGIELLIDQGFTDDEITTLVKINPAKLVL